MKTTLKVLSLITFIFNLPASSYAVRLWGDDGVYLGKWDRVHTTSHINWHEDEILFCYQAMDEDALPRVAVQILRDDGSVQFEVPLYLSDPNIRLYSWDPRVFSDGNEGAFFVWKESTGEGRYNNYMQHLNPELEPLWQDGGVRVLENVVNQYSIRSFVSSGPDDNAYLFVHVVTEIIDRTNLHSLRVLRLDLEGNPDEDYPEEGRTIFDVNALQYNMVESADSGVWVLAVITENFRNCEYMLNKHLFNGELLFEDHLQPHIPEGAEIVDIKADGFGGIYIVFKDSNTFGLQHYDDRGNPTWNEAGAIPHENGYKMNIDVFTDQDQQFFYCIFNTREGQGDNRVYTTTVELYSHEGNELILQWRDPVLFDQLYIRYHLTLRDNSLLLYREVREEQPIVEYSNMIFYRIDTFGGLIFEEDGLSMFVNDVQKVGGGGISCKGVLPMGDGGFYALFYVFQNYSVFAVLSDGEFLWENRFVRPFPNGIGSIDAVHFLRNRSLRIIHRDSQYIRYQLLHPDGQLEFNPAGRFITRIDSDTYANTNFAVSASSMALHYRIDNERLEQQHYLYILDGNGDLHPDERLDLTPLIENGRLHKLVGDSLSNFWVLFETDPDSAISPVGIYKFNDMCQRINNDPIIALRVIDRIRRADMVPDGEGGGWALVCDYDMNVFVERIDDDLSTPWDEPVQIDMPGNENDLLQIIHTPEGFTAISRQNRYDPQLANITAIHYNENGERLHEEPMTFFDPGVSIPLRNSASIYSKAVPRNDGGIWLAVWGITDNFEIQIRIQLLSPDGERMLSDTGLEIPAMVINNMRTITNDGQDGLWFFWTRHVGDRMVECRGLHLNSDGEPTDEVDEMLGEPAINGEYHVQYGAIQCFSYGDGSAGVIYNLGFNSQYFVAQRFGEPVNVDPDHSRQPFELSLREAYPNPFNNAIKITYSLSKVAIVKITIYNISGREVMTLYDGVQFSGTHEAYMNSEKLTSGIYYVRLEAEGELRLDKVLCLK